MKKLFYMFLVCAFCSIAVADSDQQNCVIPEKVESKESAGKTNVSKKADETNNARSDTKEAQNTEVEKSKN
jgi:hypothetical protein